MRAIGLIIAAAALVAPAAAHASGGGLTAGFGGKGAAGDQYTYVAIGGGNTSTIQMIRRDGGAVERFRQLKGVYGVPQVAYDGSTTGLSHDGGTLVLSDIPRTYPVKQTRLMVLDARTLKIEQRINLRGFYSVDAVSPRRRDDLPRPLQQAHDRPAAPTRSSPTTARPAGVTVIMDPDEPDEQMSGMPLFRVTSADGRYEFTLYDNAEEPFIHMLDTAGHSAECIDLAATEGPRSLQLAAAARRRDAPDRRPRHARPRDPDRDARAGRGPPRRPRRPPRRPSGRTPAASRRGRSSPSASRCWPASRSCSAAGAQGMRWSIWR